MTNFFIQLRKTLILFGRCKPICIVINLNFYDNSMFVGNLIIKNPLKRLKE